MMTKTLPPRRRRRRIVPALAALTLLLGACVKLPDLEETLANAHRLSETSYVLAADGRVITPLHEVENREVIPIDQVPVHVQQAVVAIEDERFFSHPGVDFRAIVRALLKNTAEGRIVEGGSTITQQYIKNALIDRERNIKGKLDEALLAWQLENKYSKQEILGLYLNTVYFGQGAYGIEAAAGTFFGKHARDLTVHEGALLAGLIKSPTRYDPYAQPEAALNRRNLVLEHMREQGYLAPEQALGELKQKLGVQPAGGTARYPAPYFVEYVKDLIQRDPRFDIFGASIGERVNALFKGGLRIHTTIDLRLQKIAEDASAQVLSFKKDPYNAFVAMDPRTGEIKAMVGGRDFFNAKDPYAKFNLAAQSRRQPGSSFKTFTLVGALEEGIPLEKIYRGGSVISIPLSNGQTWVVHNYDSLSFGSRLSLREATTKSVNVVYAQVVQEIGADKVVDVAHRMGITSKLSPFPSIAIGAQEVSPLEMASAYSPLANGGYAAPPVAITKITDAQGKVLFDWTYQKKRVLEPGVVALAVDALKGVVESGTGRREQLGRPAAGKTGTADEYHDAWFAGFVPQMVGVSWVGFPKAQIPMYPPYTRITVVGGSWPGQIWKLFMQKALKGIPPTDFPVDEGSLIRVVIDGSRGCLPNAFTPPALIEERTFIKGTEPKQECTEPTSAAVVAPNVIGKPKAVAIEQLEQAGFTVTSAARSCPSYPTGYVCDQSPAPGTTTTVGAHATIYVSDDNVVATVPMVLGMTAGQAKSALEKKGFVVEIVTVKNPDGDYAVGGCRDPNQSGSNRVWLQTFCAGEQRPKGSVVRIYVNP